MVAGIWSILGLDNILGSDSISVPTSSLTRKAPRLTFVRLSRPMLRVKQRRVSLLFWAHFDKGYLAVGLVLLSLLSLTAVYRTHPVTSGQEHTAKSQTSPSHQRTLKSSSFESAAPAAFYLPLPVATYTRQPMHADRTLSPRRLPGSYYNRPPPSLLS